MTLRRLPPGRRGFSRRALWAVLHHHAALRLYVTRPNENYLKRLSFVEPRLRLGHFATSFVDFVTGVRLEPLCMGS